MSNNENNNTSHKKDVEKKTTKVDEKNNIKEEKKEVEKKVVKPTPVEAKKKESKEEKPFPKKATTPVKKATSTTQTKTSNAKKTTVAKIHKKPNYILIAGIIIILIPCIFLGYLLLGSHGNSNEPVEGNRFENSLDPKIQESEVTALKDSLSFDRVENIDVSLKSATLRINVNAADDISEDDAIALMNAAYEAAIAKFPIETYFINKKNTDESIVKMYDLQVTVYNYIGKTEEEKEGQIQVIRTKNAAAASDVVDIVSTPKNAEVTENLLNPDTSQIPESEE